MEPKTLEEKVEEALEDFDILRFWERAYERELSYEVPFPHLIQESTHKELLHHISENIKHERAKTK